MSKKTDKTDNHKKRFLTALTKSMGNVSEAVRITKLSRANHYTWLNEDEEYAKAVSDIEEANIDFAENALRKQIEEGIPASTMFYLKTKGKKRGYVERQEVTGADGTNIAPIQVIFDKGAKERL